MPFTPFQKKSDSDAPGPALSKQGMHADPSARKRSPTPPGFSKKSLGGKSHKAAPVQKNLMSGSRSGRSMRGGSR